MGLTAQQKLELIAEPHWKVLRTREGMVLSGDVIVRYLENIDRKDLDGVMALLQARLTVLDPGKGNGQFARLGTWKVGRHWMEWDEQGTLRIFESLYRDGTPPVDVVTKLDCQYRVETSWFVGVTAVPDVATFVPPVGNGVFYDFGPVVEDTDTGRLTTTVSRYTRLHQTTGAYTAETSAAAVTTELKHDGVRAGGLDENGAAVAVLVGSAGSVLSEDRERNADCTERVTQRKRVALDQTFAGGEDSAAAASVVAGHTEGDALGALTAAAGTIVRGEERPTEAGNFATRVVTTTPKDQTTTSEEHSAAADGVEVLHTEGATIADKSAATGTVRKVQETPTEAGNLRTVDRVVTPLDQTFAGGEDSAAAASLVEGHTEGDALGALTAAAGTIVRGEERPTEAGNFATRVVTTTPKDQTTTSEEHSAAADGVEVLHTEGATIADKSAATGTVRKVQETPTEAGNLRTVDRVVTPLDQTFAGGEDSAAAASVVAGHTEGDALGSLTAAAGTIVRGEERPTEAGNFATRVVTTTPKDQTTTSEEHSAAADGVEVLHTEGATIADKSAATGTVRKVQETPTEAGNLRTVDRVVTPLDQTFAGGEDSAAAASLVEGHTEGDALGALTAAAGTIVRGEERPTEAGNFATRVVTTTPKDQTTTSEEHSAAADGVEVLHTEGATIADKSAATGTVRKVQETPTEAGNLRTVDRVVTPLDQTFAGGEDSAAAASLVEGHTEGDALGALTAAAGTIVRGEERPTEAGNFATRVVTTTPKDQTFAGGEDSAAAASVVAGHTEGDALGALTAAAGTIVRGEERPTEAGNFATRVVTTTPKDQTFAGGEDSAAAASVVAGHTEGDALGALTAAAGTIVRGEERPTEAGNFATRVVTTTPKDQEFAGGEDSAAEASVVAGHTEGDALGALTAAAGTIVRGEERPTAAGNFATRVVTTTPKPQELVLEYTSEHRTVNYASKTEQAAGTAAAAAAAFAEGKRNFLSGRMTPAGNEDFTAVETSQVDATLPEDTPWVAHTIGPMYQWIYGALKAFMVYVTYSGAQATAAAHCNEAPASGFVRATGVQGGYHTGVTPMRGGIFQAVRVEMQQ